MQNCDNRPNVAIMENFSGTPFPSVKSVLCIFCLASDFHRIPPQVLGFTKRECHLQRHPPNHQKSIWCLQLPGRIAGDKLRTKIHSLSPNALLGHVRGNIKEVKKGKRRPGEKEVEKLARRLRKTRKFPRWLWRTLWNLQRRPRHTEKKLSRCCQLWKILPRWSQRLERFFPNY